MITSTTNSRIKSVIKLSKRREREKTGLFLIEGCRECQRALEQNWEIVTCYYTPSLFKDSVSDSLLTKLENQGIERIEVAPHVFEKIAYREGPDGFLAVAKQRIASLEAIKKDNPFLLLVEGIEKPGNLGSMLRSSDAAGVDALIICDQQVDVFSPNVVRASMGTLFSIPCIPVSSDKALAWCKQKGIELVATTPSAKEAYTAISYQKGVAIAMGSEKEGLSQTLLEAADVKVMIPMRGLADSLNVSAAATLLLFEVIRQRGA